MPFESRLQDTENRPGRLRLVLAVVFLLIGAAVLAQIWFSGGFSPKEEVVERTPPQPPSRIVMEDYELPEPEIVPAAVPVARAQPEPERPRSTPMQPIKRYEPPERQQRLERLPGVSLGVQVAQAEAPWAMDGRMEMLWPGCALRAPVEIPAVLHTAVDSEIGGIVIARVQTPVYSRDQGYQGKVLIPAGTEIQGFVDRTAELTLDRGRVNVVWTQMSNPTGFGQNQQVTQVSIGNAWQASADGSAGLGGRVDHQWGKVAAYAAFTTIFDAARRGAINDENLVIVDSAGRTVSRVGEEILSRSLDWEPKIRTPAGRQIRVIVDKTIRVC